MFESSKTLNFESDWAKVSWVYVYIFSDNVYNKVGFGGYSPTTSSPLSQYTEAGTFDMAPY